MVVHKGRAVVFGGVADQQGKVRRQRALTSNQAVGVGLFVHGTHQRVCIVGVLPSRAGGQDVQRDV